MASWSWVQRWGACSTMRVSFLGGPSTWTCATSRAWRRWKKSEYYVLSGGGAPLVLRFAAAAAAASECPGPSGAFWYYLQVGSPVFIQQAVPTNQPTNQHGCVVVCRLLQGLRPNCKSGAATMELNAFIDVCGPSHGCMCVCVCVCVCVSHHMGVYVCGPSHWCMCVWAITWMYVCVGITWVYGCVWAITWVYVCVGHHLGVCVCVCVGGGGHHVGVCVWAITWVYVCHMGVCGGGWGCVGGTQPILQLFSLPYPTDPAAQGTDRLSPRPGVLAHLTL